MAEERIIDNDRDSRYRFRVNEDGEEELVIDDVEDAPAQEQDEEGEQYDYGAEEAQLEEEERKKREKRIEELLENARKDISKFKFSTALEYLEEVEELDNENGELYALRVTAYTSGFTDYSQITVAAKNADGIKRYASAERKAELFEKCHEDLEENIEGLRREITELAGENEQKKAQRAVKFKADRIKALIAFAVFFAALATCAALAGYFSTLIHTVPTNKYTVLTIVFGALAGVMLLADAFAARWVNITFRRMRLNRRNTSTQLGREVLSEQIRLKAFLALYSALKD